MSTLPTCCRRIRRTSRAVGLGLVWLASGCGLLPGDDWARVLALDGDGDGWIVDTADTANPSDCDDQDSAVFPEAEETCLDGVINDCRLGGEPDYWALDACRAPGELNLEQVAAAEVTAPAGGGFRLGAALAEAGDLDGDGLPDLVVAAPDAQRVYLVAGWPGSPALGNSLYASPDVPESLAFDLSGPGDLDGDGIDDLLVGATDSHDEGAVFLVSGPWTEDLDLDDLPVWASANTIDEFATAIDGSGDLDDDGTPDLVAGAWNADGGQGRVYVLTDLGAENSDIAASATATWYGSSGYAAGWDVASGGDVDGDGQDDALIAAPGATHEIFDGGAAWLVSGYASSEDGLLEDIGLPYHTSGYAQFLGITVSIPGDLNQDGRDDVIVGALSSDAGGAYASTLFGQALGGTELEELDMANSEFQITRLGQDPAFVSAGDLDQDGTPDLLVGTAPLDRDENQATSTAWLFYLPLSGDTQANDAAARLVSEARSNAGAAVAMGADHTDDGLLDLIVGAPLAQEKGGAVYLIAGGFY